MTTASRYWTAATVLIVLGVAVQQGMFKSAKSIAKPERGNNSVAPVTSPALGQFDSVKPLSVSQSLGTNRSFGPIADRSLAKSAMNEDGHTRQALGTDESVIGTPFSVSASVEAKCKGDHIFCRVVYKALTKFSQEPRDNAWASETEANIQYQIESQGPDKYSIRNLECRTTVCAVEVSSLFGPYLGLGYYYDVKYSLMPELGTIGVYERAPLGGRIEVTLMTFTRHQHLCPINPCDISSMTPP